MMTLATHGIETKVGATSEASYLLPLLNTIVNEVTGLLRYGQLVLIVVSRLWLVTFFEH